MSERQAVLLVTRREFGERLRQRSLQISTAITVGIVAAVAILAGVLGGGGAESHEVGVQGGEAAAIGQSARAVGSQFDVEIELRRFDSAAAARAAVSDEEVDAAVVGGTLITRDDPPEELEQALQAGSRQVRAGEALREEGVSPAEARRALDPPPLRVEALDGDEDDGRSGVAFTASIVLYSQLILLGIAVATGVVEEKASRVIEVLLAAITPRALLAGKIVGIGLLGLLQLLLIGVVGLAAAGASGALELDAGDAGALGVALLWFLLGYALWATLYAISGVIVSRQEDLQSSSTVLTMLLVISYLLVFPTLDDPSSTLSVVGSLIPLCSPIVMPVRVMLGEAGGVEIAASILLLVGTTALLVRIGGRIYEGAILRMGRPLKLAEAWQLTR
jgi:ABC-2 type transport system permease protein